MKQPQVTDAILIVVADQRRARLAAGKRLRNGRVHVEALSRLEEQWDESLHKNPPSRSDVSGHVFDNRGHTDGERIHRFAREMLQWLDGERPKHAWERMILFAEPRLLGALRREAPSALQKEWKEYALDLSGLSDGELALRPEVLELLPKLPG